MSMMMPVSGSFNKTSTEEALEKIMILQHEQ